jgi:hypothetical protein
MDLVLRYLENAVRLRDLAALETDPKVRADLEKQAQAYYKLAERRARERDLPIPDKQPPP